MKEAYGDIRRPVVAGQFYPDSAQKLRALVDELLAGASKSGPQPIALVSPHAGYVYSGHVAAAAFKQAEGVDYDALIVLSAHTDAYNLGHMAVWPRGAFRTPLGDVAVDAQLAQALVDADEHIQARCDVHLDDHSIEVQLPFLQRVLPNQPFVPIAICDRSQPICQALAQTLVKVLKGRKALIVASSDLSHYPLYDDAVRLDRSTLESMCSLDPLVFEATIEQNMSLGLPGVQTTICGQGAVKTVMLYARAVRACADIIKYANSGDVARGGRQQVVGYGAVRFAH